MCLGAVRGRAESILRSSDASAHGNGVHDRERKKETAEYDKACLRLDEDKKGRLCSFLGESRH